MRSAPRQLERLIGDHPEHRGRLGAAQQFGADVAGGRDPGLPVTRQLVEPGVLHRDARGRGQGLDEHLVVLAERLPVGLVGEVEVAEHLVADAHRDTEKRPHRRVIGREPDRSGMPVDVVEADWFRIVDQHAEHTTPLGQMSDQRPGFVVDALIDELGQLVVVACTPSAP